MFKRVLLRIILTHRSKYTWFNAQLYTHLLENRTYMKFIQELLEHNDLKTILRYNHLSQQRLKNIKSPNSNL